MSGGAWHEMRLQIIQVDFEASDADSGSGFLNANDRLNSRARVRFNSFLRRTRLLLALSPFNADIVFLLAELPSARLSLSPPASVLTNY
jgi:hypothetical protein